MARVLRSWLLGFGLFLSLGLSGTAHAYILTGELVRISPSPFILTEGVDFVTFNHASGRDNAGLGNVTATVVPVDFVSSTSGCEAADFAGFPAGSIAAMLRGTCAFSQKVLNATAAGALGALIVNTLDDLGTGLGISLLDLTTIPALFVDDDSWSTYFGQVNPNPRVRMAVSRIEEVPAAVPEPGSLALLAIGLVAISFAASQRRSSRRLTQRSHVRG